MAPATGEDKGWRDLILRLVEGQARIETKLESVEQALAKLPCPRHAEALERVNEQLVEMESKLDDVGSLKVTSRQILGIIAAILAALGLGTPAVLEAIKLLGPGG